MQKVLMIAHYFPPYGGGGVQRTLKFVKYLPEFNWQPIVLAAKETRETAFDYTLCDEIPDNVKVYRTRPLLRIDRFEKGAAAKLSPSNLASSRKAESFTRNMLKRFWKFIREYILIPDREITWALPAVIEGLNVIAKEKVDVIYTTSPPHSCHLTGFILRKLTGKPWIIDFRDPWTQRHIPSVRARIHKHEQYLEYRVLKLAGKVIANTPLNEQDLVSKYGAVVSNKVVTITNGYDSTDFRGLTTSLFDTLYAGRKKKCEGGGAWGGECSEIPPPTQKGEVRNGRRTIFLKVDHHLYRGRLSWYR